MEHFDKLHAKLLEVKIPNGQGIVGKVIASGEPEFFRNTPTGGDDGRDGQDTGFHRQLDGHRPA